MKPNLNDEQWYSLHYILMEMFLGNFAYRLKISGTNNAWDDFARVINLMAALHKQGLSGQSVHCLPNDTCLTMAFVLDDDFCIREANKATEYVLEIESGELQGKPFGDLLTPHSRTSWDSIQLHLQQRNYSRFNTMRFDQNGIAETPTICCFLRSPVNGAIYVTSKEYSIPEDLLDKMLYREMQAVERHIVDKKQENDEKRVREVANYIEEHLDKPWSSTEELAKTFGTNEKKLKMDFKKRYKTSIYHYCINKRMDLAMDLLNNSDKSIQEIMLLCGYKTPSSFYIAFKQRFGCTPGDIRRNNLSP